MYNRAPPIFGVFIFKIYLNTKFQASMRWVSFRDAVQEPRKKADDVCLGIVHPDGS
jgi:hypothetical protein